MEFRATKPRLLERFSMITAAGAVDKARLWTTSAAWGPGWGSSGCANPTSTAARIPVRACFSAGRGRRRRCDPVTASVARGASTVAWGLRGRGPPRHPPGPMSGPVHPASSGSGLLAPDGAGTAGPSDSLHRRLPGHPCQRARRRHRSESLCVDRSCLPRIAGTHRARSRATSECTGVRVGSTGRSRRHPRGPRGGRGRDSRPLWTRGPEHTRAATRAFRRAARRDEASRGPRMGLPRYRFCP
jgi:hypothetical protein